MIKLFISVLVVGFIMGIAEGLAQQEDSSPIPEDVIAEIADNLSELQRLLELSSGFDQGQSLEAYIFASKNVVGNNQALTIHSKPNEKSEITGVLEIGVPARAFFRVNDWFAVGRGDVYGYVDPDTVTFSDTVTFGFAAAASEFELDKVSALLKEAGGYGEPVPLLVGFGDAFFEGLVRKAIGFQRSFATNPYVRVKGFQINLGFSPSVSLVFEFP